MKTWKSLDELSEDPELLRAVAREFPENASLLTDPITRREFLRLMGASLAFAGLQACIRLPLERIVPFVSTPEGMVPGMSHYYSTTLLLDGYPRGVLVKSYDGRPVKIEGNPEHPASLGATDLVAQAEVLSLYDPDRSQHVLHKGANSTWADFTAGFQSAVNGQTTPGSFRVLCERTTSPTILEQLQKLQKQFPQVQVHFYSSVQRGLSSQTARLVSGKKFSVKKNFAEASVVLSVGDDFLGIGPEMVRYSHDFFSRRRQKLARSENMNRLYVVEGGLSQTGATADHRLPANLQMQLAILKALATEFSIPLDDSVSKLNEKNAAWVVEVAKDLKSASSGGLVTVGENLPQGAQVLSLLINEKLKSSGRVLEFCEVVEDGEPSFASLENLRAAAVAGKLSGLLILGGNPIYSAPPSLDLAGALRKIPFLAHASLHSNETSQFCGWNLPLSHILETWGDAVAPDGTASLIQPLISPLYDSKSILEILADLSNDKSSAFEITQQHWKRHNSVDFENFWETSLRTGVIVRARTKKIKPEIDLAKVQKLWNQDLASTPRSELEFHVAPDPSVWDGSYSNNGWLQETPKPFSKITWSNAIYLSVNTAKKLSLKNNDEVELQVRSQKVRGFAWLQPAQADGVVVVNLGYGKLKGGTLEQGRGFNAFALRKKDEWQGEVTLTKTGAKGNLATTQTHHSFEGRDIVRVEDIQHLNSFAETKEPTLLGTLPESEYAWGLVTDLSACSGCNACLVACQSENNVPIVGEEQVRAGREMHWLRVDSYYSGEPATADAHFQPLACVHCESAPCEVVCPTAATNHSSEGLNQMIYNRCVGTRFCSNNCPYKVRRFNFLQYADVETENFKLMRNPEVTVRSRGVMEKCSYCVQRINAAHSDATLGNRKIRDGDIKTACQQACPTNAIQFGNIRDRDSQVSQLKAMPTNYGLLSELGTLPRSTYLAKIKNKNPRIKE